jgi:hypothetical protein
MWAQKKRHGNYGGNNNDATQQQAVPKLRGTGDIEALLKESQSNDKLEKQEKERGYENGSSCGCGW